MARSSASPLRPGRIARMIAGVAVWGIVVGVTGSLCTPLGDALQRLEEGIELRLHPPTVTPQAPRTSEPEPIEPWELVSV